MRFAFGLTMAALLAVASFAQAGDDDLKISSKAKKQSQAPAAAPAPTAGTPSAATAKPKREPQVIRLKTAEGADPHQAWSEYFAAHPDVAAADIAHTADVLMHGKKQAELVAMIEEAIVPQPGAALDVRSARNRHGSGRESQRRFGTGVDVGGRFL